MQILKVFANARLIIRENMTNFPQNLKRRQKTLAKAIDFNIIVCYNIPIKSLI